MPPWAAFECERTGCTFEIIATSAPICCAWIAARMPARPPPMTRTSCSYTAMEVLHLAFREASRLPRPFGRGDDQRWGYAWKAPETRSGCRGEKAALAEIR